MTDSENIAWIIDHMVTMTEQMSKMQESITYILAQMVKAQQEKKP